MWTNLSFAMAADRKGEFFEGEMACTFALALFGAAFGWKTHGGSC